MARSKNSGVVTLRVDIKKALDKLRNNQSLGTYVNDILQSAVLDNNENGIIYPFKFELMEDTIQVGFSNNNPYHVKVLRRRIIQNLSSYSLYLKKHAIPTPIHPNSKDDESVNLVSRYASKNLYVTDNQDNFIQILFPRSYDKIDEEFIVVFPQPLQRLEKFEYEINYEIDYVPASKSLKKYAFNYSHKFFSYADIYIANFEYPKEHQNLDIQVDGTDSNNPARVSTYDRQNYLGKTFSIINITPKQKFLFQISKID